MTRALAAASPGRIRRWIHGWCTAPACPRYLAAFRVLYCLALLPIAVQSVGYTHFRFFAYSDQGQFGFLLLNVVWIASLGLMLAGRGGRLPYVLNMLAIPVILDPTVGTSLFRVAGFWMIFMGTGRVWRLHWRGAPGWATGPPREPAGPPALAWPVILMAINVGVLLTTAGLSKAFDPLWRSGIGFYYTFSQPWLKPSWLNFLLELEWLMIAMNYLTVASETLTFPLLLFRRTRVAGLALMTATFVLLTFPFRIDPIGPAGLVVSFGVISVLPSVQRALARLAGRFAGRRSAREATEIGPPVAPGRWRSLLAIALAAYLAGEIGWMVARTAADAMRFPNVKGPLMLAADVETAPAARRPKSSRLGRRGLRLGRAWRVAYRKYRPVVWYAPFNAWHILGRYQYAVRLNLADGRVLEPVAVFDEQGRTRFAGPSGGILRPRILQNRMWAVGKIAHMLSFDFEASTLTEADVLLLRSLVDHSLLALPRDRRRRVDSASVWVRLYAMPPGFAGDVRPWLDAPWVELYRYDDETGGGRLVDRPARLDLTGMEIECFRSGQVIVHPQAIR